jgi:hypothetical protein
MITSKLAANHLMLLSPLSPALGAGCAHYTPGVGDELPTPLAPQGNRILLGQVAAGVSPASRRAR